MELRSDYIMETLEHIIIKLHKCKWCGKEYIKTHNRQEYCTENGTYCKDEAIKEQKRNCWYNNNYKNTKTLGNTNLPLHIHKNTTKEHNAILTEMRRHGLKT